MTKEIKIKDFNHFQELVIEWADERNMFSDNNKTLSFLLFKLIEQMGELGEALINGYTALYNKNFVKEKIGICCVVLVIMSKLGDCQVSFTDEGGVYHKNYLQVCKSFAALVQSFLDPTENERGNMYGCFYCLRGLLAEEFCKEGHDHEVKNMEFIDCCQLAYNEITTSTSGQYEKRIKGFLE